MSYKETFLFHYDLIYCLGSKSLFNRWETDIEIINIFKADLHLNGENEVEGISTNSPLEAFATPVYMLLFPGIQAWIKI